MLLLLLLITSTTPATEIPCWMIRDYLASHSEAEAKARAKAEGYSAKEVADMRKRCLK